ncbi:DegT/DnrJ/EryC1/StrS family aminotransferase [Nocardioides mesophilus]|uniref:DegT/DnrJ/EryC1/StrS family aminotransferase n=1 Tax=Nocardioides mesophilus TaxID=433659 RepID=A0A7G9R9A8_9ACTN|nr:DegT/DnrJ/EryC1/StrS family aminotransferase [Nocardioides mesophilus]QNN52183.1 DegT/DnrJ/EryC1/StrS family aminotransferase [Nocardioides mesophilus]
MSAERRVPLVDLAAQHTEVAEEVRAGWDEVCRRTGFVGGPEVAGFERAFADYVGVRHCIGVANGTDALEMALRAAGVGAGAEVVLPANTFVATAEAVVRAGAVPVLADVDDDCLLLDPERAAQRVTPRTRALVPVHLYGQSAPVEQLLGTAEEAGAVVVEDAAQSQGATRHGRAAGSLGTIAGTSFYPGKNLGAYGDAGAVVTDDPDLADRVRALGSHGSTVKYEHPELGFNSRLDTLQAVVLTAKLRRLERWNQARREAARRYDELLADVDGVRVPATLAGNVHVWHLYVVRVEHRDEVLQRLNEEGIGAGIHYPLPVHLQGAFRWLGHGPGDFPVTERAATQILSLPLHPHLTAEDQEHVVEKLAKAVRNV